MKHNCKDSIKHNWTWPAGSVVRTPFSRTERSQFESLRRQVENFFVNKFVHRDAKWIIMRQWSTMENHANWEPVEKLGIMIEKIQNM